jgi:hypothetical protein
MGQAAELEVLLEHRTKQLHAAEARANDLQVVALNTEKQNAELKYVAAIAMSTHPTIDRGTRNKAFALVQSVAHLFAWYLVRPSVRLFVYMLTLGTWR